MNVVANIVVLAAAFRFRAAAVPVAEILPQCPAARGMLAGAMSAAGGGAGWVRCAPDRSPGRLILFLLAALGCIPIVEGLFETEPARRAGEGMIPAILAAAAIGVVIGLVSSRPGVAGVS